MKAGELKIQLVGYAIDKEGTIDEIAKSPVIKAIVGNSVNGIITEGDADPSMIEILKAKLDKLLEEGINVEGSGALPVAYINENGELCFELSSGINDARINNKGELELLIETENGDKTIILGKVKGRTPEFRLTEKILEIKYDDENTWSTLVDFSTIASSFDLRLNEETYFLEAQREVAGEWEPMVDLSALKLAHEHTNKAVLDKFTEDIFKQAEDTIKKKHTHNNLGILDSINQESLELIDEIPGVLDKLSEPIKQQLKESLYSEEDGGPGFSTSNNSFPVGDYIWVEGEAAHYYVARDKVETRLVVNTTTSGQSTTTTATIEVEFVEGSSEITKAYNALYNVFRYAEIMFYDDPQIYVIYLTSVTLSGSVIKIKFLFAGGYPTFPLEGTYTKTLRFMKPYPILGKASHSEGFHTVAVGNYSHVQGRYNELDIEKKYAHIIGNGTYDGNRSNAHTVDWEGNAWYAGGISAKNLSLEEPIKTSELINDSEFITIDDIPESNNLSVMVSGETLVLSSSLGQEIEEAINEIEAMIDESGVLDE